MALLDAGHSDGAYYLAGYAVECALKACICRKIGEHEFPPKPEVVREYYSHRIPSLLKATLLDSKLGTDAPEGSPLDKNWGIAKRWSQESRYSQNSVQEAKDLYNAIADPQNGVLVWLQQNW